MLLDLYCEHCLVNQFEQCEKILSHPNSRSQTKPGGWEVVLLQAKKSI